MLFFLASCAITVTPKVVLQTGGVSMEINKKVPPVTDIDHSPDGKSLVSGGWNNTVRIWDLVAGREIKRLKGHTGFISGVAYSRSGSNIASISNDLTVKIWDAASGREINNISDLKGWMVGVFYLPDDNNLAAVTIDWWTKTKETTAIYDIRTGNIVRNFTSTGKNFPTMETKKGRISPDGKRILTQQGNAIVLNEVATHNEIWRTKMADWDCTPYFMPNGQQIIALCQKFNDRLTVSGRTMYFTLLDAATGKQIKEFGRTDVGGGFLTQGWYQIGAIAFSPDNRFILTGDMGGRYKLWDISAGKFVRDLKIADELAGTLYGLMPSASFSPDGRTAVVESIASNRLIDIATGKELAAMISFEDEEWIVITPDGYYNSSENGHRYLNVLEGNNLYAVEQFYDVFYRPDIVAAKLRGDDIRNLVTITMKEAIKSPPPAIVIAPVKERDSPQVKVCYQVQSLGGGIGEVRLFHNGKLIQSDGYYREFAKTSTADRTQLASLDSKSIYEDMRSISVKGKVDNASVTGKPRGDVYESCQEIDVIPGENELSVSAFNGSNTVQSYMKTVSFKSNLKPEEPHLYILAVGIDRYKDNNVNLKYAVKDARDIEEKFKTQAATLYKPSNIHYTLLTDQEATKTGITGKINELSGTIKPSDSFILFVAGHGVLLQNQYYLLTHDYSGTIRDTDMISSNEIVEASKKIKSLSQLFIFDTCHAGGVDTIVSGLYDARMSVLAKKMGLHIYASANDRQSAMDGYKGNGLFTHTLLDGLNNNRQADKNKDGKVTVVGLGEYSKKRTTDISKEIGHSQTPLIINFGKDSPIYKLQ